MEKPFGKYTLTGWLGGGGMAEVFRARFAGPGGFEKNVAIKLIVPSYSSDPDFVRMFMQEASLAARLDHANIVRIYEFDQIGGRYFIVMEMVDGHDLRQVVSRCRDLKRNLTVPEVLVIGMEMCKGLAFAHGELRQGAPEIVHRDISPHNIILSSAGEVKITDFGIAKLASASSHTKVGLVKGKVGYMSPEQARGEPVDRRTDIFSLGCVLWELLAGQRLFGGDSDQVILYNLNNTPAKPVSMYNPDVGTEFDELLKGMLQTNLNERIGSASQVMTEIETIISSYPDVQRGTLLSNLYRELFEGVAENEPTDVFEVHKTVSDQAKEWFEGATITPASGEVDIYNKRTMYQSASNLIGADLKEKSRFSGGRTDGIQKRWTVRKLVLIGLAICCGGMVLGTIGYEMWNQFASHDSLEGTSHKEPIAVVSTPGKEPVHPVIATTVDSPAPPVASHHEPTPDTNVNKNPDTQNPQPATTTPHPDMRKQEPSSAVVVGPAANADTTVATATNSSTNTTGVKNNPGPISRPFTTAVRQDVRKKPPEHSDKDPVVGSLNKGQLQIITMPPSLVYQGDKLLGPTILDVTLPAGDYTFRLVDKKNKDKTRSVKITVYAGKVNKHRFVLE